MDKAKKIVLITAPYNTGKKGHLPPLNLGYIASYLEKKGGYNVRIIDSVINGFGVEEAAEAVLAMNPDAVGITTVSSSRFSAIDLIRKLKEKNRDLLVFVGGRHFHSTWKQALEKVKEIDFIVRGEGEITTKELLDKYFSGDETASVRGLSYRGKNGQIISTLDREPIKNLDDLPMVAWHLFEMDKYQTKLEGEYETRAIGLISSRGCPNQCVFCANNSFFPTLRLRSPKNFVDEMEFLKNKYGFQAFDIWDDTLTMNRSHVLGICNEIIKRNLKIIWYARARVNTVDEKVLEKMWEAGCRVIGYGVESGSEKVLKSIKKYISIEQIKKAFYLSAKIGFKSKGWIIYGLPGEEISDLKKTRDLICDLRKIGAKFGSEVKLYSAFPLLYPGTELMTIAEKEGTIDKNFDWYKDVYFEKNFSLGSDPTIPMYVNKDLPIEKIIDFNKKYDKKLKNILIEAIYQIRQIKKPRDIKKFISKLAWFLKEKSKK